MVFWAWKGNLLLIQGECFIMKRHICGGDYEQKNAKRTLF